MTIASNDEVESVHREKPECVLVEVFGLPVAANAQGERLTKGKFVWSAYLRSDPIAGSTRTSEVGSAFSATSI